MSFSWRTKISEECYHLSGMSGNRVFDNWFYDENLKVRHRMDGPAVIESELELPGNKSKVNQEWWYMGEKISVSSQEEFERYLKLKVFW